MKTENKLTAMQEIIEYLENHSLIDKKYLINKCKSKLEKEKQQIIDAGNGCAIKQHLHHDKIEKMSEQELRDFAEKYEHVTFGEQYYEQTFKND